MLDLYLTIKALIFSILFLYSIYNIFKTSLYYKHNGFDSRTRYSLTYSIIIVFTTLLSKILL